jgi:hypothetical protein
VVTPSELLTAALRYAELGYRVFPCTPGGKTPLTEHGFHDATTDAEQIERWWTQHPSANIGIATEGLVVIDIDGDGNSWPGDPDHAADLASAGAIALTPRGGRHLVFRRPEGRAWTCSTGKLVPGVDVRTDGSSSAPSGLRSPELMLDSPRSRQAKSPRTQHPRRWWCPGASLRVEHGNDFLRQDDNDVRAGKPVRPPASPGEVKRETRPALRGLASARKQSSHELEHPQTLRAGA